MIGTYRGGGAVAAEQGALFYGQDVLAMPGEPVELIARLRKPKSFRGIADVVVAFDAGAQRLGTAVTDRDGFARLAYTAPSRPGDTIVTLTPIQTPARMSDDVGDVLQIRYDMLVAVRPPGERFIVVDLDHTIVDGRAYQVVTGEPPAMADASDVLWRLSERDGYSLIYLTQRPDALTRKSKHWLTAHRFPPGVLVTVRTKEAMGDTAEVKTRRLRELMTRWEGIVIGVGDREGDCLAYLANDMQAYVIPDLRQGDDAEKRRRIAAAMLRRLPDTPNVQAVRNWKQIEQGITQGKRFPAQQLAAELDP
ncbi:MAG: hypothetical protein FWE88_01710 [Phycisphaerae bacterium]|nr:hypothetical protein [Phycisphaerae bacterium]